MLLVWSVFHEVLESSELLTDSEDRQPFSMQVENYHRSLF
jgi:hypothetical protein